MHIMSMLCFMTDAVNSGSCSILFNVLMLNVVICIVLVHFSKFCLCYVADFSNTEARAPTSIGRALFFPHEERCGLDRWFGVGHGNLSITVFILIYRSQLIDEQQ